MKPLIIAASILLSACLANRTTIESSWADAEYSGPPLDRVAIVALFPTRADSLAFERNAADYLAANGVEAVPAHALLTPAASQELDESAVREQLAAAANVDGVLLFRLVAVDERREYQVPTPYLLNAPPDGTPPAFSANPPPDPSYYWFSSDAAVAPVDETAVPGYWIEQTFLVAETALFDNRQRPAVMDREVGNHGRRALRAYLRIDRAYRGAPVVRDGPHRARSVASR